LQAFQQSAFHCSSFPFMTMKVNPGPIELIIDKNFLFVA
jgi:hypothetical protein